MKKINKLLAMSALLLAAEDPNSDMPEGRRALVLLNNEMAMVSGQALFARSDSAKEKWLKKLDNIEARLTNLKETKDEKGLTEEQFKSLSRTQEDIDDMRSTLSGSY